MKEAAHAIHAAVFNEGYAATAGAGLIRRDLCREAIRMGRLLARLMPAEPEIRALLALVLLHDARRDARLGRDGDLVLLEDQDRTRWDRRQIAEGLALLDGVVAEGALGAYAVQAAIAAAAEGYRRALGLTSLEAERRFLVRRLRALEGGGEE